MAAAIPLYKPLVTDEVEQIDQGARYILEHVGINVLDNACLDMLGEAGAEVDRPNQMVKFRPDWLDSALAQAPSSFVLHSRDGYNDIHLGEGKVHFTNGGRVFHFRDGRTGQYRYTMLRHVARTAALVQNLDYIRFYMIACQAHTVKREVYHLNDFFHSFNNTTKHVMGGCDNLEGARQVWELAGFIAGGEEQLRRKPFLSIVVNPISPLTMESNMLNVLRFCCTHGIPVACDPSPMAGATSPVTLAGTLAQMHAEALACAAISQVFSPGAKVLYGAVPTVMDMRKMDVTMGSIEMAMMNAAAVQLAGLYKLPIFGTAGVTESKISDVQTGSEKSMSSLLVAMAGADCIHLAAGMLDSANSISYAQYVIDNEIIGTIHRVLSGIRVDQGTLALDVIGEVGAGGNYVMHDHTIEYMMDEFFYPQLAVRSSYDVWEEQGRPDMLSRSKEVVQRVLAKSKGGVLGPDLVSRIRKTFPGIQNAQ